MKVGGKGPVNSQQWFEDGTLTNQNDIEGAGLGGIERPLQNNMGGEIAPHTIKRYAHGIMASGGVVSVPRPALLALTADTALLA